ncbi:hypothetical protein AWM75_07230 [Aerococcus urinaehominis]|uniref:Cell wall-active antibiotics response LiaF-like C-terminal domain-containing protein n=1 Tax=Aerococcus urinaehominis TaxID=128944 RepID=A0A0X8FLY7_9LACT|nr:LiaF domain-containing protein [Aerococcus urinaehominis]AMB99767.1 hypothetical protein AWM75_07230 [Aerococcus urinaehominis]SDM09764.1 Predicted membrane protein [Aerococcus urinaehominis]
MFRLLLLIGLCVMLASLLFSLQSNWLAAVFFALALASLALAACWPANRHRYRYQIRLVNLAWLGLAVSLLLVSRWGLALAFSLVAGLAFFLVSYRQGRAPDQDAVETQAWLHWPAELANQASQPRFLTSGYQYFSVFGPNFVDLASIFIDQSQDQVQIICLFGRLKIVVPDGVELVCRYQALSGDLVYQDQQYFINNQYQVLYLGQANSNQTRPVQVVVTQILGKCEVVDL